MISLYAADYYAGIYPDGLLPAMDRVNIHQLAKHELRKAWREKIYILDLYDYLLSWSQALDKLNKMEIGYE